ncbi:MAG: HAD family phosphatase [Ruthenibacterium sp.]
MTIKSILFDMDGLMFDTERLSEAQWIAMGKHNQIDITAEDVAVLRGKTHAAGKEAFEKRFGKDIPFEAWAAESNRGLRAQLAIHVPLRPHLVELLDFLKAQGFKMAVASSTESTFVEQNLQRAGVRDYFSAVIGGDAVTHSKPAPEIFLTAAATLCTAPADCIVLEDSYNGIRAGAAAGCFTVMVPDLDAVTPEMQMLAQAIVPDLAAVIPLIKTLQKEGTNDVS